MTTTDRVPLRISLNPSSTRRLDGAWWPQSRDLQVECADLIDNFPSNIGRPARLLFSRPDWTPSPTDRPPAGSRLSAVSSRSARSPRTTPTW